LISLIGFNALHVGLEWAYSHGESSIVGGIRWY